MLSSSAAVIRRLLVPAFVLGTSGMTTGCSRLGASGDGPRTPGLSSPTSTTSTTGGAGTDSPAGDDATRCFDGAVTYYADSLSGRPTASGEAYDPAAPTAAHRTLPFGTWLRVERSGRTVMVRVNDRGPYSSGVVLDVSRRAAEAIDLIRPGRATARICVVATNRTQASRR
jgi:rare lipoprotein A